MKPFLCPYCGALKDKLREVARVPGAHEIDLGFVFCNRCLGLIVWPLVAEGEPIEPRQATAAEVGEITANDVGRACAERSLAKWMERRA